MKIKNIKVSRKLIALLVAGGITIAPVPGTCLTNNSYNPGTFVREIELNEDSEYGKYIVKEGDNLSKISEKVCSHLRIEISTKYWPTLAYLNHYPRVIKPGDIIIFPKNAKKLEEINSKLQKTGWTSKYKQMYKVYGTKVPKKKISMKEVGSLLYEIYGDDVCVDEDFIRRYLEIEGLDNKYILSTNNELNDDDLFNLTEWIPTLDELNNYQEENKPKVKKKK